MCALSRWGDAVGLRVAAWTRAAAAPSGRSQQSACPPACQPPEAAPPPPHRPSRLLASGLCCLVLEPRRPPSRTLVGLGSAFDQAMSRATLLEARRRLPHWPSSLEAHVRAWSSIAGSGCAIRVDWAWGARGVGAGLRSRSRKRSHRLCMPPSNALPPPPPAARLRPPAPSGELEPCSVPRPTFPWHQASHSSLSRGPVANQHEPGPSLPIHRKLSKAYVLSSLLFDWLVQPPKGLQPGQAQQLRGRLWINLATLPLPPPPTRAEVSDWSSQAASNRPE